MRGQTMSSSHSWQCEDGCDQPISSKADARLHIENTGHAVLEDRAEQVRWTGY